MKCGNFINKIVNLLLIKMYLKFKLCILFFQNLLIYIFTYTYKINNSSYKLKALCIKRFFFLLINRLQKEKKIDLIRQNYTVTHFLYI